MSVVLYRKYRSQRFSDLVGQNVIVQTLLNALKQNRVGHAYLFAGPRGTGKTSTARILAKAVNCLKPLKSGEPCNKCKNCKSISSGTSVDIIEIDAASHTGVDDVRGLVEKIEFSPVLLKKKVYIIDEVHMLSKSAFNALLKTLEEPPAHVIFILATTEIHKIPVTILSRCQRFDFRLGTKENVLDALRKITDAEGVQVDAEALGFVASVGSGSYRDAISTLESVLSNQAIASDKIITADEVRSMLGLPDQDAIEALVHAVIKKDAALALSILDGIVSKGTDAKYFSVQLLDFLRSALVDLIKLGSSSLDCSISQLFAMIKTFSVADRQIHGSNIPQLPLEMALIELTNLVVDDTVIVKNRREKPVSTVWEKKVTVVESTTTFPKKDSAKRKKEKKVVEVSRDAVVSKWAEVIRQVKPFNGHLFAFLAKARIDDVKDGCLYITVSYDFYKERIEDKMSRKIIAGVCQKIFDVPLDIVCTIGKVKKGEQSLGDSDGGLTDDVMDVFSEDVV